MRSIFLSVFCKSNSSGAFTAMCEKCRRQSISIMDSRVSVTSRMIVTICLGISDQSQVGGACRWRTILLILRLRRWAVVINSAVRRSIWGQAVVTARMLRTWIGPQSIKTISSWTLRVGIWSRWYLGDWLQSPLTAPRLWNRERVFVLWSVDTEHKNLCIRSLSMIRYSACIQMKLVHLPEAGPDVQTALSFCHQLEPCPKDLPEYVRIHMWAISPGNWEYERRFSPRFENCTWLVTKFSSFQISSKMYTLPQDWIALWPSMIGSIERILVSVRYYTFPFRWPFRLGTECNSI